MRRKLARSQEMHFSIRNFYKCVKGRVCLAKVGNMSVSSHHKFKPLTGCAHVSQDDFIVTCDDAVASPSELFRLYVRRNQRIM